MIVGAIGGYSVQVAENRSEGMNWGVALTTNISGEKIVEGAIITGGIVVGAVVIGTLVTVGATAISTTAAVCLDGDCTNEVKGVGDAAVKISSELSSGKPTTTTAIQPYYPPNMGFYGKPQLETLQPGTLVSRYGNPSGSFLSPAGTPFWARSLPPGAEKLPLNTYEVVKPIQNVLSGTVAPWWGQIGGAIQYYIGNPYGQNVRTLLASGYLQEIK